MTRFIKWTFSILLCSVLVYISCSKELSCENNCDLAHQVADTPPVASAGTDTAYVLPRDTVGLDGSASYDTDGSISKYSWRKISGPEPVRLTNTSNAKALLSKPVAGIYVFELLVTDDKGLTDKDSVTITISSTGNKPPIANAGPDQVILLPANTVILDGSASTDPDDNIKAYSWRNISGPAGFQIDNARAAESKTENLTPGVYQFELTVTDQGGLSSMDTVVITVQGNCPLITGQLIPFGTLSESRTAIATATAGNKILFAGGSDQYSSSTRVDIYDIPTDSWSTAELSEARDQITVVSSGTKIFFAGGYVASGTGVSTRVDIYDAATNSWSTAELSEGRALLAAAAAGNKVIFAGGYKLGNSDRVDIYDMSTNTWTTASLSQGRWGLSAVSTGSKIYFAGGESRGAPGLGGLSNIVNTIDIYDAGTNSWSVSTMGETRGWLGGIFVGGNIYWLGGAGSIVNGNYVNAANIEIRDPGTSISTFTPVCSSVWGSDAEVVQNNNDILLFSVYNAANKFLKYDMTNGVVSDGKFNIDLIATSVISVNNTIYVAGGFVNGIQTNQVWKLSY
jgi:hypothetical protein